MFHQPKSSQGPSQGGVPARPERLAERWARLAERLELAPQQPLIVALSGGADSVLLTHLVAAAEPPLDVVCVHVDHDLRGDESRADARFCESLCRSLGLPLVQRYAPLPKDSADLEARARELRYAALFEEARRGGPVRTVLTGHHADDALETLLMRWMRGTGLSGMSGLRERVVFRGRTAGDFQSDEDLPPVTVLRPLITMRRSEVRRVLSDRGNTWREDSSNQDPRFFRNRLRHGLLEEVADVAGGEGLANLRAFSSAVESLEDHLARATAHLAWQTPSFAAASRDEADARRGGELKRHDLVSLSAPLMRRALWRLLTEGSGAAPGRHLLDLVTADLTSGRCARHSLPGNWSLVLRSDCLQLLPPAPTREEIRAAQEAPGQALMPWGDPEPCHFFLPIPGILTLPDGRRLSAELEPAPPAGLIPRGAREVLIDAAAVLEPLIVRWARPGDRFHPLGAPGGRPLVRFLADAGVPREERGAVPLVVSQGRILWAAGLRPADPARIRPSTTRVLRLVLHTSAEAKRDGLHAG